MMLFILLYLIPRILFAFRFPIFNDEAIMIHIGRFVVQYPENILKYAIDGRQPGFFVATGLLQMLRFDPLLIARGGTIVYGLIACIATILLADVLGLPVYFRRVLAIALATSPFLILFDTMLLPDAQVTAGTMVSLLVVAHAVKHPTVGKGMFVGIALAIAWWYFSLILLSIPALLVYFAVTYRWERATIKPALIFWISAFMTLGAFQLPFLLLHRENGMLVQRTVTISDLLAFPWRLWLSNATVIANWFIAFIPVPLLVFVFFALRDDAKRVWRGLMLFSLVPIGIAVLITKLFSARNIVFVAPVVILIAVRGLQFVPFRRAVLSITLGVSVVSAMLLVFFPIQYYRMLAAVPLAQSDFGQYVSGWPSGYGVKEAVHWFAAQAKHERFVVVVRNDSGNPEDAMFSYLEPLGIPVVYPDQMYQLSWYSSSFYFVSRGSQQDPFKGRLQEITRFTKPIDKEYVGIYKIVY